MPRQAPPKATGKKPARQKAQQHSGPNATARYLEDFRQWLMLTAVPQVRLWTQRIWQGLTTVVAWLRQNAPDLWQITVGVMRRLYRALRDWSQKEAAEERTSEPAKPHDGQAHWDAAPTQHRLHDATDTGFWDAESLTVFRQRARRNERLPEEIATETDAQLLARLNLATAQGRLKRAAVLLFHADPASVVTGASIKVGFFRNHTELLYQDSIEGSLLNQIDKVLELLQSKYMQATISYRGEQRLETLPLPKEALREAVANAIVHKDYSSGIPIQISIYSDRLMIWNPGQLPAGWSEEQLRQKHPSVPRNPDLARVFFLSGLIESWGRGTQRILEVCRDKGTATPQIQQDGTGFWIEFPFAGASPLLSAAKTSAPGQTDRRKSATSERRTPQKTPQNVSHPPNNVVADTDLASLILSILAANPDASRRGIAEQLGETEDSVRHQLKKLKATGRIRHVGPSRGGHWEVV